MAKSSLDAAIKFFSALRGNAPMLISTPDIVYGDHLTTLNDAKVKFDDRSYWATSAPINGTYSGTVVTDSRVSCPVGYKVISDSSRNVGFNPTSSRVVDYGSRKEVWVSDKLGEIQRYSITGTFLGGFGTYGNASLPNAYSNVSDFAVDVTNNKVAVAMRDNHIVKIFNLTTYAEESVIGVNGVCGVPADTKLSEPVSVCWTPSGDLLVACFSGKPTVTDFNSGYVAKYSDLGVLDSIVMKHSDVDSGDAWHLGVRKPIHLNIAAFDDGVLVVHKLYITYFEANYVGEFNFGVADAISYSRSFGRVQGFSGYATLASSCVDPVLGVLYIASNSPEKIISIDLASQSLLGSFGVVGNVKPEIGQVSELKLNSLLDISGISFGESRVFIPQIGNQRLISVPNTFLTGTQEVVIGYSNVGMVDKRIVATSSTRLTVSAQGAVNYTISREDLHSDNINGVTVLPTGFILMLETDR